ncbi:hypothetical protein PT287_08355 [Lactobacillus sp. ESL0679]|uniref:hypothetical protein n=1 Tax=Lactobacillus sp. ESL0679 TaxID=2983209 RepID=UPI0023F72232|nr:hypothetical protein [Lactobacillus sp. ESL0679]MDF7683509.1 hypothetical protein [Lactobacillus sp. ESL0679]
MNGLIDFLSNLILKVIPIKSMPYWIAVIAIVLIILGYYLIKQIPKIMAKNIEQSNEFKSSHQLQIESYFRDISGTKLEKTFSQWTDAILNIDSFTEFIKDEDNINDLIKNTILYGSSKTIEIASLMMHYIYTHNQSEDDSGLMEMAYFSEIISSLKSDFSGYNVSPQVILKLKFNDWNDIKDEINGYLSEIEEELRHVRNT